MHSTNQKIPLPPLSYSKFRLSLLLTQAVPGIVIPPWYASNNGCNLTIEQSNFNTLSSMKSNLDAGRLLQVEVEDFAGTSGGHSIAVTGYSSNSLYVQNGWNRNRIAYSYSSLDIVQYVYIG